MTAGELREWREAHGMTQALAAHWVGVSRRTWIRWEVGDQPVPKWLKIIATLRPSKGGEA